MAVRRYSQGGRPTDEDILFCGELRFTDVDEDDVDKDAHSSVDKVSFDLDHE